MEANTLNEVLKTIAATYRHEFRDCPADTMERMMVAWFESFREYSDEEVLKAFRICLRKCKFPPTIADLVERIEKARDLKRPSKAEIWERVIKAVGKTKRQVYTDAYGYKPLWWLKNKECKNIFYELPQSVRTWMGFDCFCSYAEMTSTALNVERARFMKEIDDIRDTIRDNKQIAMNELLALPKGAKIS